MRSKIDISDNYKIAFEKKGWKPLCYLDENVLVFNKGQFKLLSLHNYESKLITELDVGVPYKYLFKSRLLSRLLRLDPRGAIKIDNENVLIPLKGKIYHLNIKKAEVKEMHTFREEMSAPLSMTKTEKISGIKEKILYGEYFSNPEKKEVGIWGMRNEAEEWREVYKFKKGQIEHIHAIIPDPYQNIFWILTGDHGDAAGIWFTEDGFKTVNKYLTGKQTYRSCVAFPTRDGLLYATDTPLEDNYIYLLQPDKKLQKIYSLEGSTIYGGEVQNEYIFSTTVEGQPDIGKGKLSLLSYMLSYQRGKGIKSWYSEIVIGNYKEGFKRIGKFKKDLWPMNLMQFGTIMFPSGENKTNKIILYGSALKNIDGTLLIVEENPRE